MNWGLFVVASKPVSSLSLFSHPGASSSSLVLAPRFFPLKFPSRPLSLLVILVFVCNVLHEDFARRSTPEKYIPTCVQALCLLGSPLHSLSSSATMNFQHLRFLPIEVHLYFHLRPHMRMGQIFTVECRILHFGSIRSPHGFLDGQVKRLAHCTSY